MAEELDGVPRLLQDAAGRGSAASWIPMVDERDWLLLSQEITRSVLCLAVVLLLLFKSKTIRNCHQSHPQGPSNLRHHRSPNKNLSTIRMCLNGWPLILAAMMLFGGMYLLYSNNKKVHHQLEANFQSTAESCVITVSAWNRFGFVATLYDSIVQNSPTVDCFVWFVSDVSVHPDKDAATKIDEIRNIVNDRFKIVTVGDMHKQLDDNILPLAFQSDTVQLAAAIRPFAFQYTFEQLGASSAIYLDNDIWVTGSLEPLQRELLSRSVIVTPHILSPLPEDSKTQKEIGILTSRASFGFVAFSNTPRGSAFLEFWGQRPLSNNGYISKADGTFVDQNWGIFIPSFLDQDDYLVLRDPRYNIAYWNLHERGTVLRQDDDSGLPYLGDKRAVFVHFSGMSLIENFDMKDVSRYQGMEFLQHFPQMKGLTKTYADLLEEHNTSVFCSIPYGYNYFSDGRSISSHMQSEYATALLPVVSDTDGFIDVEEDTSTHYGVSISAYGRSVFQNDVDFRNPFCVSPHCKDSNGSLQTDSFRDWYLKYVPNFAVDMEGNAFFSGLEYSIWQMRPDVQTAFPDPAGKDFSAFKSWFLASPVKEGILDKNHFDMWHALWMEHRHRHSDFHKRVERIGDVGVNIVGWHGGQFSIGMLADKLVHALKSAEIPTRAIQNHVYPGMGKIWKNPNELGYELTRSPYEIVNLHTSNGDNTWRNLEQIPSAVWEQKYNIGYWAWEFDKFPDYWVEQMQHYDEVWCLSTWMKEALDSSSAHLKRKIPIKVLHVPLWQEETVNHERGMGSLPYELNVGASDGVQAPFTFLVVFDFQSYKERKNPMAAIRAFLDAFPAEHGSGQMKHRLIVKSHSGTPEEMTEMKHIARGDPRIIFINRVLPDSENIALHRIPDCYVSLHRSEGYGLNILESMASGIPVIATNYSGNVDFFEVTGRMTNVNEHCIFPVPYTLFTMKKDIGQYKAGNRWAEADHEYAVEAMRKVARRNCKTEIGDLLSKQMKDHFSELAIGKQMQALLLESFPRILEKQRKTENNVRIQQVQRGQGRLKGRNRRLQQQHKYSEKKTAHRVANGENERHASVALVRPFSPGDAHLLRKAMEEWNDHIPCNSKIDQTVPVDLILAYSRNLHEDDEVLETYIIDELISKNATGAIIHRNWKECFREIHYMNLGFTPKEDIYDKRQKGRMLDWVAGPNKVFRTVYQKMHEKQFETMFLMELDALPLQDFWLDTLLEEMKERRPFAVLGSKHAVFQWQPDHARQNIPSALMNHLNGNSFYNLSSVYMNSLVSQLDEESTTQASSIPFDYRLSQIHELAVQQVKKLATDSPNSSKIPRPFISKMQSLLSKEFGGTEAMKETAYIETYAGTAITKSMIPQEAVIRHSGILFDEFDSAKMGYVTLVVTNWTGESIDTLLKSIEVYGEKIAEVLVVGQSKTKEFSSNRGTRQTVRHVKSADQCSLRINTKWFMYVNSLPPVHPNVLLMTTEKGQVVAWGSSNGLTNDCREDPLCLMDFKEAEILLKTRNVTSTVPPTIYYQNEFLFHTESHDDFCRSRDAKGYFRPTATSFMAYVTSKSAHGLYYTINRALIPPSPKQFVNQEGSRQAATSRRIPRGHRLVGRGYGGHG